LQSVPLLQLYLHAQIYPTSLSLGAPYALSKAASLGVSFTGYIHTYLCQTHGLFDIDLICLGDALMTRHASYLDIENYCLLT
jgi:hypothetical protein